MSINWKESFREDDVARKAGEEAEQIAKERRLAPWPDEFSSRELLDFVGARKLLEGVRKDVWGVGEIVEGTTQWSFPRSDFHGSHGEYCDFESLQYTALSFRYPVLSEKYDSVTTGSSGSGDSFHWNYSTTNRRVVIAYRYKMLGIVVANHPGSPDINLCVTTYGCVIKPFQLHKVAQRISRYEDLTNKARQVWKGTQIKEKLAESLKKVVLDCRYRNDLPLQLKASTEKEVAECHRNGGIWTRGSELQKSSWLPLKEK